MKHSNSQLNIYPKAISENFVVQELGDETLIYNLSTNQAFCLNPTSAFVWKKCDGQTSVSEIAKQLSRKTNQLVSEEIVWLALNQLQKEKLIIENNRVASYFGEMSRREVIRRVGLASMIALPLISSIVAPTAAQAQSGTTSGACTDNCLTLGAVCGCAAGTINCPTGATLGVTASAGVCVTAAAAAALGITVTAGANGNVCLAAAVCVL